jgi:hypothetical protein
MYDVGEDARVSNRMDLVRFIHLEPTFINYAREACVLVVRRIISIYSPGDGAG